MNPSISEQSLHRFAGHFAADGVEAGNQNGARSVIDQDRDARSGFECADVASFAADDAAFNLISLKSNRSRGVFERVFPGVTLDGDSDDLARFLLGPLFSLVNDPIAQG